MVNTFVSNLLNTNMQTFCRKGRVEKIELKSKASKNNVLMIEPIEHLFGHRIYNLLIVSI